MLWLLRKASYIDKLANIIGRLGSWLILPLIAVIIFDVLARKFQWIQQAILNSPLHDYISPTKLQELEWHLHAAVFVLAYGMAYLANAHVRVDVLRDNFSHRKQGWIELVGLLLFALPFLGVVVYFGWDFVARAYLSGEGSDALTGIPHRWIIKSLFFAGLVLLLLVVLSVLIKLVAYLFGSGATLEAAKAELNILSVELGVHLDETGHGITDNGHTVDAEDLPEMKGPST